MKPLRQILFGSITLVFLAGCATTPPPREQMTQAQAALSKAEGVQSYQYAPVEFNTAQEKFQKAKAAMGVDDYARAKVLAEEAEVDANLAYTKSRSAQAQKAVRELQENIETLRREIRSGS